MAAMTSVEHSPRQARADDTAARYHRTQLVLGIVEYVLGAA